MAREIKNNFAALKADFKKDTGLDFNQANMLAYISYYNARMADQFAQYAVFLLQDISTNTRPRSV